MPMSDRDRLAELLALHRLRLQARPKRDDAVAARCKCGVVIAYTGPPYEKRDELRHRIQLGWEQHLADALIAAGVTMPAPPAIPDRAFIDDYGRRWEWCGGTEGTWAWRITAMPEPPAVCGASAVICGIEYVCGREREHTESVHECTDDIGVMQWRDSDSDEGPVVVRAWTHDGSDGWPVRPARPWRKRCEGDADDERRCCLTEGHDGECR